MSVRIHAEDLQAAVRAMPWFALHLNTVCLQDVGNNRGVGQFEGVVERAAGANVFGGGGEAGRGASFMSLK